MQHRIWKKCNILLKFKKASVVSLCACCILFTSCTTRIEGSASILKSSWAWYQRKYNQATAGYLQTIVDAKQDEDIMLEQYAVYNLATTYLMQNETEASLERYSQINEESPKCVKYATYYNMGIIAHRNGEYKKAVECFTKSLEINEYQSHTFYRRALAYYELQEYENSMNDTIAAQKLGLEEPGLEALHSKLIEKFDMNM